MKFVVLTALLLTMAGCRQVPAPTGGSSVAFVEPAPAPPLKSGAVREVKEPRTVNYREARPIEPLAKPVYPLRHSQPRRVGRRSGCG